MITIPCSLGELIDKITILQIKLEQIKDKDKLNNVLYEYRLLTNLPDYVVHKKQLENDYYSLYQVNLSIWNDENSIREYEQAEEFDREFITIARRIRQNNDQRSRIKKKINKDFNSCIIEEKSHRNI